MATSADLRNAALEHIEVLAAGETASAEDAALVDRIVANVLDGFAQDGFTISTTSIPAYIFEELTAIVGTIAAPKFGKQGGDISRLEVRVRSRLAMKLSEPVRATYY